MKFKKYAFIFMSISLIFSQFAFAARFGGGRSRGMQRSYSSSNNSYYNNSHTAQPQPTYQPSQPGRSGIGAGTAAAVGAVAGAAGGYMLGRSMSEQGPAASTPVTQAQPQEASSGKSSIPWGIIAILGILLLIGLLFFRKKIATSAFKQPGDRFFNRPNNFQMPNSGQSPMRTPLDPNQRQFNTPGSNVKVDTTPQKMPDGVETIYFLRQVKGMFLHIQSMNNSDNMEEIQKYMTADLYQEVKEDMSSNKSIADFTNLDCQLLNCEIDKENKEKLLASVRFVGLVSEEPTASPVPFNEIWNFVKADINTNRWLIAGIQQTAPAT